MPSPSAIALSVMIPNFNYGRFIGDTIQSVLAQAPEYGADLELVVTDNASTDNSVAVVRGFADPRVRLEQNPCNVGFSANCERVTTFARGRRMLLLSSDDRMAPGALAAYGRLERALGDQADRAIWGSVVTHVDGDGKPTGVVQYPDPKCWRDAEVDEALSQAVGHPVRKLPAAQLLRRCLELLRSPLPFLSTCYSRAVHDACGGYSGGRLMNPDKWFIWKALGVADMAYYIDAPLFDYRVHGGGQGSIELKSGALKHLTDEYIATFNLPESVLAKAGIERDTLAAAFVEHDIALRGFLAVAQGKRATARRGVSFGRAAYPDLVRANPKVWALRALLACGPVGTEIARRLKDRVEKRWAARESQRSGR